MHVGAQANLALMLPDPRYKTSPNTSIANTSASPRTPQKDFVISTSILRTGHTKALWAEKICLTLVRWYEEDGKFLHASRTPSCTTHKFLTMPRACWCPTEDQEAENPALEQTQAGSLLWGSATFRRGTAPCPRSGAYGFRCGTAKGLALPARLSRVPCAGHPCWKLGSLRTAAMQKTSTAQQVGQRGLAIGKVLPGTLSEGATFTEPSKADWVWGRRACHIVAHTRVGSDICGFTTSRLRGEQTHTYLMQIS